MLAEARNDAVLEGSAAKLASLDMGLANIGIAACRLMLQAGHTERAVASIQALLEFACLTNVYAAPGLGMLTRQTTPEILMPQEYMNREAFACLFLLLKGGLIVSKVYHMMPSVC